MNGKLVGMGTTAVVLAIVAAVVWLPHETFVGAHQPSDIYRELTELERRGRLFYL